MESYEGRVQKDFEKEKSLPPKIHFSLLRYFWEASPLSGNRKQAIPKFLRSIQVLKNFTDNELRIFSSYLHLRNFTDNEVIFKEGEPGFGFYIILSGQVQILAKRIIETEKTNLANDDENLLVVQEVGGEKLIQVATLEKLDYFGELALIQNNSIRTANAVAKGECNFLGMFRPDMEEMLDYHPEVGSKLLQSIALLLANRLTAVTTEIKILKYKISQLEKNAKVG